MQRNMTPISTPSPESMQGMFKDIPTPQLLRMYQQQATNPRPDIKLTLLLGELNNREDLKQAQQQAPTSTVAQDVVQKAMSQVAPQMPPQGIQQLQPQQPQQMQPQAQPQQPVMTAASGGVVDLPVPDHMFQEHHMAGGGIVAFDEGGRVPRYAGTTDGSLVSSSPMGRWFRETFQPPSAFYQPPEMEGIKAGSKAHEFRLRQINQRLNDLGGSFGLRQQTPEQAQEYEALKQEKTRLESQLRSLPSDVRTALATPVQPTPAAQEPPPGTTPPAGPPAPAGTGGANQPQQPPRAAAPGLPSINYNLPNFMEGVKVPEATQLNEADFLPEKKDLAGITALRQQAYKAAGVSEDPMKEYIESLKGEKEGLKKDKENAFSDALIDFGSRMMAGRGQLGEIIGKSLNPAAEKYSQKLDKLKEQEHDLNKQQFAAADALNRYRQTGAESDLAEYRSAEKDLNAAKRDYAKTNAQLQDTHAGRQFTLDSNIAREKGDISRAQLSAKLQAAGLELQRFSAETQRLALEKPTEASFLVDRVTKLYPNDPQKQIQAFADAIASSKPSGDNTLRAVVGKDINKALTELRMTKPYLDAQKKGDTEAIRQLENEVRASVMRSYSLDSGKDANTGGVSGTYNPKTGKIE